jgi:hypothetical protein
MPSMHGSAIVVRFTKIFTPYQLKEDPSRHNEFEIMISPDMISPSIRLDVDQNSLPAWPPI